ncbi:MAG: chromosome partitioning protein [Rhodospirillaceae bacterium BRH_c57]|nr:MAG: chromosome partitioning protein [Rhodospirillaceae bacterium BRH_c57]
MNTPFVLAVSNRKGGSGKSTSAVNLAAEWANRGSRVLVVDLDTQGHAGFGLGITPDKGAPTAHDIFRDPTLDISDAIVPCTWANLWCAPADFLFEGTDERRDPGLLASQLRRPELAAKFDIVILDTPPSLDQLLVNAMSAADGVLIPMLPHALSAEGVKQLSRLFYRIATTSNPGLKLIGLLPIMYNPRLKHHQSVVGDIVRQFGAERVMRGIRVDTKLAEAFAARKPIRYFAPRSHGALDYFLLADELAQMWGWRKGGAKDTGAQVQQKVS